MWAERAPPGALWELKFHAICFPKIQTEPFNSDKTTKIFQQIPEKEKKNNSFNKN